MPYDWNATRERVNFSDWIIIMDIISQVVKAADNHVWYQNNGICGSIYVFVADCLLAEMLQLKCCDV